MKYTQSLCLLFFLSFTTICCTSNVPEFPHPDILQSDIDSGGASALAGFSIPEFSSEQLDIWGHELSFHISILLEELGRDDEAILIWKTVLLSGVEPWRDEVLWIYARNLEKNEKWADLEALLLTEGGHEELLYASLSAQGKPDELRATLGEHKRPFLMAAALGTGEGVEEVIQEAVETVPASEAFLPLSLSVTPPYDRTAKLVLAKIDLAQGRIREASPVFLDLLENPEDLTLPLIDDIIKVYRGMGTLSDGAGVLNSIALNGVDLDKNIRSYLYFGAGRLYRWAGGVGDAAECFRLALDAPPAGQVERIRWYRLDVQLKADPQNAVEIFTSSAPSWDDPGYYNDIIDELFSRLIEQNRFDLLEELYPVIEQYGNSLAQSRVAYLQGRKLLLEGDSGADEFFHRSIDLRPTSVYGWYSRYFLDDWEDLPGTITELGFESFSDLHPVDEILDFYLSREMLSSALSRWGRIEEPEVVDQLILTNTLQTEERYLESIQFLGGVGPSDSNEAWKLRFPRGYKDAIEEVALWQNLSIPLFFALVRSESGFSADIVSWAGAVGLAQLMPATAEDVAMRMKRPLGELTNPVENLELGGWYLNWLKDYVGSPWAAVLAYNGGPGRVRGWQKDWDHLTPDLAIEAVPLTETRDYGRRLLVSSLYYGYLYYDIEPKILIESYFGGPLQ